jgi:Dolichyl-phosphate-mannose-protein mannosyltransferase
VVGLLYFAPTMACVLGGAWIVQRRRYSQLRGAERVVALGLLAVLGTLAAHLVPLLLGLLDRPAVFAAAVLWLAAAAAVPGIQRAPSPPPEPRASGGPPGRALAGATVGLAALLALAVARDQLFLSPLAVDTLNFHLPSVAAWIQSGSLWQIDVFLSDVAPGHYPNNGDVLLLAAVLPWSNDFLSHLAHYPVYLLTGAAVYALARELRASRAAAAAASALLLATPAVLVPALISSYTDILALFGFAVGVLFLLRHHRTGHRSELVLAGLALGVTFGTKWYGVSTVAVVLAVWALASLVSGRGSGTVARQAAALAGLIALAGGIWMLRNWVESGNPVFPVRVAPLGLEIFDAPRDVVREMGGFALVDYVDDPDVWVDWILPQYRDVLSLSALVLLTGFVLAVAALVARGRHEDAGWRPLLAAALACALILVAYAFTPYSAGGPEGMPTLAGSDSRYSMPAFVIAAALCAWVAGRFRHGIAVLSALGLLGVLDAAIQISVEGRVGTAVDRNDWLAAIAFTAAAALLAGFLPRGWARLDDRRRRLATGAAVGVGVLALAIGGYETQKRFNGVRYVGQDPTVDHILQRIPEGQRVGLTGTWDNGIPPVLPAFGPRLGNHVAYVGWNEGGFRASATEGRL